MLVSLKDGTTPQKVAFSIKSVLVIIGNHITQEIIN
jgi:hypothetical protein